MRRSFAAAAAAVTLLTASAPASTAATTDDGLWYYTATGMDEIHQRTTGAGITIAILDDPVRADVPDLAGTGLEVRQPSYCATEPDGPAVPAPTDGPAAQHGTFVASVLVGTGAGIDGEPGVRGVAPDASVVSYAVRSVSDGTCYNPAGTEGTADQAIRDAVAAGADIINVSGTVYLGTSAYADALRAGVVIVAAAGNEGGRIAGAPATTNGAVTVGTVTADRELDAGSPTGPELGVVAPGSGFRCLDTTLTAYARCTGSSNASAYTSGVLALLWSLHPDATGNQILQALVHTTDGEVRETPVRDDLWGYGTVNARTLVDSDPLSYPDVNPFVRDGADEWPTAAELGAPATPSPSPTGSAAAPDSSAGDEAGPAAGLVIGAVGLGIVLVGGVVVVLVRGRRRDGGGSPPGGADGPHTPTLHGGHHG